MSERSNLTDEELDHKPDKQQDTTATDKSPDRTQAELTEQNLVQQQRDAADTPHARDEAEEELEEMEEDIQDANDQ